MTVRIKRVTCEVDRNTVQPRPFRELPCTDDDRLIIGVLSPQLATSFFGGVLVGISKVAAQKGAAQAVPESLCARIVMRHGHLETADTR